MERLRRERRTLASHDAEVQVRMTQSFQRPGPSRMAHLEHVGNMYLIFLSFENLDMLIL